MEVTLFCAVVGVGSVFPVDIILSRTVGHLKDKIKEKEAYGFPASKLKLYLARDGDRWLNSRDEDIKSLKKGKIPDRIKSLMQEKLLLDEAATLDDEDYFRTNFIPRSRDIHVLVELPSAFGVPSIQQTGLWLVRGSIANAPNTKGVRCRLYRLAGLYLGYYDPAHCSDDNDRAFWYDDKTLRVHVLFKTEDNALQFENALRDEKLTIGSPLYGQVVMTTVDQHEGSPSSLRRVYYDDYEPQENESPQDTMSSISLASSDVTIVDSSTEEFRYQRIEHERYFLPYDKAESCHLVSKKKCNDDKRKYGKYNRDPNNRLALSREMHGFYDGLSYQFPIVSMTPGAVEKNQSIDDRYKVEVFVKVLDAQCKDRVFSRLKEGSTQTNDPLVMKTFVHVKDPETFCFCLRWKHEDNDAQWSSFLSMVPAVD